jgi:hypothetical protein
MVLRLPLSDTGRASEHDVPRLGPQVQLAALPDLLAAVQAIADAGLGYGRGRAASTLAAGTATHTPPPHTAPPPPLILREGD